MKHSPQKAAEANTRLIFVALSIISAISIIDVLGTRILNFAGPAYSIITSVFAFIMMFSIFLISWVIILRLIAPFTPIYSSNSSIRLLNLLYRILEIRILTIDSLVTTALQNIAMWTGMINKFRQYFDDQGYRHLIFDHRYGIKWSRIVSDVFRDLIKEALNLSTVAAILPRTFEIKIMEREID